MSEPVDENNLRDFLMSGEPNPEDNRSQAAEEQQALLTEPPQAATFLGMTAPQRFIIALMILVITFFAGSFILLLNGKIYPPF